MIAEGSVRTGRDECRAEWERDVVARILADQLSADGVRKIVEALQQKRYIVSAVLPRTPESETFGHFLERFWNYETSPYVQEKKIMGQSIHRRYVDIMLGRARSYWIPAYGTRPLGSLTKGDVKRVLCRLATVPQLVGTRKKDAAGGRVYERRQLCAETVNQIVRAATCALKWAYHNGLTATDCFSGMMYCHVVPAKRGILTISQAREVFRAEWEDGSCRLANLTALCTGLRIGEVQALQRRDLARDRIYVRHNWARTDGLKCPKNGEERAVRIPPVLYGLLRRQAAGNPFGQEPEDFVFWGYDRNHPCNGTRWNRALRSVLRGLGIPGYQSITFHSWRHFFTTNMADYIDGRKLQLATGHKSLAMLEHYAAHESEQTLLELGRVAEALFLPIITGQEGDGRS